MTWFRSNISRNLQILAVVAVMLTMIYAEYVYTLSRAVPELSHAKTRIKTQKREIRSLTQRLESSKTQEKVAEQEANVMRQANQLLRAEESNHQAELNRLKSELDFYQRLAGTSGTQDGLAIYYLELTPTGSERVFHFVLTLTQNLRRSAITSGNVRIDLEGTMEDRPLTLPWARITDSNQPEPAFRFKYFQQLAGYLALPENFQPSRILVTLEAKGQSKRISRSFDWLDLTAATPTLQETPAADQEGAQLEQELDEASGDNAEKH
jgi:hypothetical protein